MRQCESDMRRVEVYVQQRLFELRDPAYRDFHSSLMPTIEKDKVIGVRTPALRQLAKELKGTEAAEMFINILPHTYYEENNLHGCLIGAIGDYEGAVAAVNRFLPYVDNWATCDMLSPKIFKKHRPELLEEIDGWLASPHTYTTRFGIGMLMIHFLDADFKPEYPEMVAAVHSEEYYVNMMIAWYFATALAKRWDEILPYIEGQRLAKWVHNKTIQKAVESRRISAGQKQYLRTLRL